MGADLNQFDSSRHGSFRVLAILCALLLIAVATLKVAHSDAGLKSTDHCQICLAIHCAFPTATAHVNFVFSAAKAAVVVWTPQSPKRFWAYSLWNRPPPSQPA